ncbi:MAG: DNA mismatch repair endonuclease MutL [Bacteroidaceae bacterium]|nr:DNA mismatch repair endonuclease MutL [Bacteroidaceae bacterium]
MSDIIHLLPDSVANQIAAGEVIQRPSSVIKELVENAIDAGATQVQVLVSDAGKTCIQVIDNGKGMSETDARMAFERHATSKISEAADLFALRTMGFRGEALASIAAVAQVELKTKMRGHDIGIAITIEGSRVVSQEPVACPEGANFAVRNLFFNIPARRKFLKSNQTELTNILAEFERIVLAHPDVAFTLHSNGTSMLNLPVGNFRQRIVGVFGKRLDQHLVPVQVETPLGNISGFVGTPETARKRGMHQFFFVNGRYMRHPYFAKAVQSAYERIIPEGEQVSFFLKFEVDPARIDVNIHPAKTEIKFQDEQPLWQILQAAVREAIGRFNAVPTIDFDTENRPDIPVFNPSVDVAPPTVSIDPTFNPFSSSSTGHSRSVPTSTHMPRSGSPSTDWQKLYDIARQTEVASADASPKLYDDLSHTDKQHWEKGSSEYFQYKGRFIITSVKSGLMLIDQHRAHMRVLYDAYRRQLNERAGVVQGLLFPQLFSLPPSQQPVLDKISSDLSILGFEISNMGGGDYSVSGIPAGTEGLNPVELIQGLVTDAVDKVGVKEEVHHVMALGLARKSAIPVGQALSAEEMEDLVEKLFLCETPNYTPNGKLVLTILDNEKVERMFD